LFSFALGAFTFVALFFLRAFALFFWLGARKHENAPAPTSALGSMGTLPSSEI
jgi:hypothetical protein